MLPEQDVECATPKSVWWFNRQRLLESIGYIPPLKREETYYRQREIQISQAGALD